MKISLCMVLALFYFTFGCEKSVPLVTHNSILNDVHLIEITVGKDDPPLDLRLSHGDLKTPILDQICSGFGAKILLYEDFNGEFLVSISVKISKYGSRFREFSFKPPAYPEPSKYKCLSEGCPINIINCPSQEDISYGPKVLYHRNWLSCDKNGNSEVSQFIIFELLKHVE